MVRRNADSFPGNDIYDMQCDCVPVDRAIPRWELQSGAFSFIAPDRNDPGPWTAYRPAPSGYHDYYIVTTECFLELAYDGGVRHKGHHAPGTIITSHSDERLLFAGNGRAGLLQIRFSGNPLAAISANTTLHEANAKKLHIPRFTVDIGLGLLALTYQFAHDTKVPAESTYSVTLRQAMLNRIAVLWSRNAVTRERHVEMLVPAKVRRVADYIEGNLKKSLTLPHLSAVAGVSRSHFARAFRNSIGMSPHQFVRHRRLAAAMRLMRSRTLTLAEIAHGCGFADQAHLTRTFKLQYGDIPTSFRRPPTLPSAPRVTPIKTQEIAPDTAGNRIYFQGRNEIGCNSSCIG